MLDEPFSNLDSDLQFKIRQELRTILKTAGITTIFVTHDRDDSKKLADRIVVLKDGTILRMGTPDLILNER
jgi:iron(III) transport system ATP-binding protein